jgi:hypothetical protein
MDAFFKEQAADIAKMRTQFQQSPTNVAFLFGKSIGVAEVIVKSVDGFIEGSQVPERFKDYIRTIADYNLMLTKKHAVSFLEAYKLDRAARGLETPFWTESQATTPDKDEGKAGDVTDKARTDA